MKFAHLADCHIGGWRDKKLGDLSIRALQKAVGICIEENTAFVLIAGDLFNNPLPSIDLLKEVAEILEKLKQHDIDVYIIPGSHDFSPSGKTMLEVLEKSGLCINVFKYKEGKLEFTVDKTNTKITGILGKRSSLDRVYYENLLNKNELEKERGFKIFMFHTSLSELQDDFSHLVHQDLKYFPKHFNYYAGGHVHIRFEKKIPEYGVIVFPGPLFPNSFSEIEKLKHGEFVIVGTTPTITVTHIPLQFYGVECLTLDADGKTAEEAFQLIKKEVRKINSKNKIVTLRVKGVLSSGKPSDIDFKEILSLLADAYTTLRNTNELTTKEFAELEVKTGNREDIEAHIVHENSQELTQQNISEELVLYLIKALNTEKREGERNIDFEERIVQEVITIFNLKEKWALP